MNKLDIYKNQDYILNDAFDQAVVNIHIQKEQNGYKTYTVCGCGRRLNHSSHQSCGSACQLRLEDSAGRWRHA